MPFLSSPFRLSLPDSKSWLTGTIILGGVLACCSCSSTHRANIGLINRIKGRGPVALSSENPYLVGNLLLSKEMHSSPELKAFLENRGAPRAVEVTQDFWGPLFMNFYYPEKSELFILEDIDGTWAIHGPDNLSASKKKEVLAALQGSREVPRLGPLSMGKKNVSHASTSANTASNKSSSPRLLDLDNKPSPAGAKTSELTESTIELEHPEEKIDLKRKNFPQGSGFSSPSPDALAEKTDQPISRPSDSKAEKQSAAAASENPVPSGASAEITPKGDLVHYVTFPKENLAIIANWYTGEASNAEKIARINSLKNSHELSMGDQIVVPSYLIKNRSRLPESELKPVEPRLAPSKSEQRDLKAENKY